MQHLRTYTVVPTLPEPLTRLRELAFNMWWCWNDDAQDLFRRLDPDLWNQLEHNPVKFLAHIAQSRLDQAATDKAYTSALYRVLDHFDRYMNEDRWYQGKHADIKEGRIAYFSMEFGLHESLPIYSGGLGILAGDHLKSASDLGIPLVGVGLMYRQGYFHQRLTSDGWQLEEYHPLDFYQSSITQVQDESGAPIAFKLPMGQREVLVHAWRAQVGRIPLILLDTDLPENDTRDREITQRLYGGDAESRIRQEVLLGIGGLRMLKAMGIDPEACHMNEGHAAFLTLERIRQCMQDAGLNFSEAREATVQGNIFTTHTPVPAGIDHFDAVLLRKYLEPFMPQLGVSFDAVHALGKKNPANPQELFSMAILALRLAGSANGVSALHGHISRGMWQDVWKGAPREEVPIKSITNGIHINTWINPEMAELLNRYMGHDWADKPSSQDAWKRVDDIPDIELWQTHQKRRLGLVMYARRKVKEQFRRRGSPPAEVKVANQLLDPDALTIGFARRFAPYKRGALIFRDVQRLVKILSNPQRPVQLVFAGKAHPRDDNGKAIIQQIMSHIKTPELRSRIVFLEDYDISVGRMLVHGVDVWLNNPIKPREASGTSGMKVAPNGGLNFSVLDGWWPEAYNGQNGWAIGDGAIHEDIAYQDHIEGETIYDLLEQEIIPLFYDRDTDGLPHGWIQRMKAAIRTISPVFNTDRMLMEYTGLLYAPAVHDHRRLTAEGYAVAKKLAEWKDRLNHAWKGVKIDRIDADDARELSVGAHIDVAANVHLGDVKPEDVAVEIYYGRMDPGGQLVDGQGSTMQMAKHTENSTYLFSGSIPCPRSGQHAYSIRVYPKNPNLPHIYDTGLIVWN